MSVSSRKDNEKFSKWYHKQPIHHYEDFQAKKNIIQRLNKKRKRKLVPELGEYIFRSYPTAYGTTHKGKNKAKAKARYILGLKDNSNETNFSFDRRFPPKDALEMSLREREKIIEQAESKGSLPDLHLNQPWHPHPFFNNELISYPVQHPNFVTYRAMSRSAFYKKAAKVREGSRHGRSVLNIGEINPGNSVDSDHESAVWTCPRIDKIKSFANEVLDFEGVIIEMNLPSKWLSFNRNGSNLETVKDFDSEFGSPKKFREYMASNQPIKYQSFLINENNAKGVPIERITGIWDLQLDKEENFREFDEDYIKILNKLEPYNIPGQNDEIGEKLQQEYTRLLQIQDYIGDRKDSRGNKSKNDTLVSDYEQLKYSLRSIEKMISKYEEIWIKDKKDDYVLFGTHKEQVKNLSTSISDLNNEIINFRNLVETTEDEHLELSKIKIESLEDIHKFVAEIDKDLEKIGDHIKKIRSQCSNNVKKLNKIRTQYSNNKISGEKAIKEWKSVKEEVKVHELNKEIIGTLRIGKVKEEKLWESERHRN